LTLWVALASFALLIAIAPYTFEQPGGHRLHPYGVDPDTIDVGGPETPRINVVNGPEKGWWAECKAERD
jgi:hypothetical protein